MGETYLVLPALIEIGILRYAYIRLGIRPGLVLLLLFESLVGSYLNNPVADVPGQQILAYQEVGFFGARHAVPLVVDWAGSVIAINVRGALIPAVVSLYLLVKSSSWRLGIIATGCVAAVCHMLAHPVPGLGITVPVFVPALSARIVAICCHDGAAPTYIGGSMGVVIGADLLNLGAIRQMGASVASIGRAGTYDGIFLTGILAVLIAGLSGGTEAASGAPAR